MAFETYTQILETAGIRTNVVLYIVIGAVLPLIFGSVLILFFGPLGGLVTFLVVDIYFGYPYFKEQKMIDEIETNLPDMLRHLSSVIRSGATVEFALRDVGKSGYGLLSKESDRILADLERGQTFETSFMQFTLRYRSKILQRAAKIIIVAKESGAGLVETLDALAEDLRQMKRIYRERISAVSQQVGFLFVAGIVISPAILSIVVSLVNYLSEAGFQAERIKPTIGIIETSLQFYILIEAAIISIAIAMMREGKVTKSILYMPFLLMIAYIVFIIGKSFGIVLLAEM